MTSALDAAPPTGDPAMAPGDDHGYVNVSQAAALLGVSRVSVSRWIRAGQLRVARLGHRTVRIRRDDVERLLEQRGLPGFHAWAGRRLRSERGDGSGDVPDRVDGLDGPLSPSAWSDLGTPAHVVQFYEQDAFLLDAVAAFVGEALNAGGAGIVIATPEHRDGIALRLHASGVDVAGASASGQYVALDAAATLGQFMVDGAPDRQRFLEAVGGVVARAARVPIPADGLGDWEGGRQVRAFGEMVALLVDDGNPAAAIQLEQLWNDLGQTQTFSLFCAYPIDHFGGDALAEVLDEVCAAHTGVIPAESFTALPTPDDRLRAIATLQQRAHWLEAEIAKRACAEEQLRLALAERERLLAAEQAARDRAEAALRARDEFLSIAAHELKTPLTSVLGQAQLILRRYERQGELAPERAVQALAAIRGQGEKLARLINQVLDVSRLERGQLTLERQPTDIERLLAEVVAGARLWSERHTISFLAEPITASLQPTVDPLRLEQALTNVLDNAVRYSPDGGEIEVRLGRVDGGWLEIAVRDHGLGVPTEKRGQLFERFSQAHADGYRSGLGLGLYLSHQIVALHGGAIWAEFPPDGGTRVVVRLPLVTDTPPPVTWHA